MPPTMPVISAQSSATEASPAPSAASSASQGEGTSAPFAEVLAKASGNAADAAVGKKAEASAAKSDAAPGKPEAALGGSESLPACAGPGVVGVFLLPPTGAGDPAGVSGKSLAPARREDKKEAASARQGGNDLPPLAMPVSLAVSAQAGAGALVASSPAPAPVPSSAVLDVRAQRGYAVDTPLKPSVPNSAPAFTMLAPGQNEGRKEGFDAVRAALSHMQPGESGAAPLSGGTPVQPMLGRLPQTAALPPMTLASLSASKDAPSVQGPPGAAIQPSGVAGQAGIMFAAWPGQVAGSTQPTAYQGAVATPLGSPHWGQDLGQQLLIGVQGNSQVVTLHVHPPELGPLQVHLQITDGQASALFVSPHPAVRQALEGALPQLRDIFAGAGMSLGQTQVSADGGGSRRERPHHGGRSSAGVAAIDEESAVPATGYWQLGFVNTYV